MKTALIIVDVQNDFLPAQADRGDGALAVPEGNDILPIIIDLLDREKWDWDVVVATQDYHPPRHISFASRYPPHEPFTDLEVTDGHGKTYSQSLWPDHCVQGSEGVKIEESLKKSLGAWADVSMIARKACYPDVEAYSAFEGYLTASADPQDPPPDPGARVLADADFTKYLHAQGVKRVVVTGLATDFWYVPARSFLTASIRSTAHDSIAAGFDTILLAPTTRAVFADRVDGVFDELVKRGGRVLGRDGKEWEGELREWML